LKTPAIIFKFFMSCFTTICKVFLSAVFGHIELNIGDFILSFIESYMTESLLKSELGVCWTLTSMCSSASWQLLFLEQWLVAEADRRSAVCVVGRHA